MNPLPVFEAVDEMNEEKFKNITASFETEYPYIYDSKKNTPK